MPPACCGLELTQLRPALAPSRDECVVRQPPCLLPLLLTCRHPGMCDPVLGTGLTLFTAAGRVLSVDAVAVLLPASLHKAVLAAVQAAQPGRSIIRALRQHMCGSEQATWDAHSHLTALHPVFAGKWVRQPGSNTHLYRPGHVVLHQDLQSKRGGAWVSRAVTASVLLLCHSPVPAAAALPSCGTLLARGRRAGCAGACALCCRSVWRCTPGRLGCLG